MTHTWLLGFIASLAAALGLVFPSVWILTLVGFALFLYVLWYQVERAWVAALVGLLFGFATSAAGIVWFWDTPPLGWLSVTNSSIELYAVSMIWFTVAFMMGLACALAAALLWRVRRQWYAIPLTGIIWAITEEARMFFFSVYSLGERSLLGTHFSVSALGYVFAENNYLLQIAQLGGLAALNAALGLLIAGVVVTLYVFFNERRCSWIGCGAIAVVLATPYIVSFFPRPSLPEAPLAVAIIADAQLPSMEHNLERGYETLQEIARQETVPDLILFPEGHSAWGPSMKPTTESSRLFGDTEVLVLNSIYNVRDTTIPEDEPLRAHAELSFWNSAMGVVGTYQKIFLMPYGEYVPYSTTWLLSLARDASVQKYLNRIGALNPGTTVTSVPFKGYRVGGLLCADTISPKLFQRLAHEQGANILANLSNFGWFHGSRTLFDKTVQIGKVHAVAGHAWFFQSGNLAPAFAINPDGELVAESTWGAPQVLFVHLPEGDARVIPLTTPTLPPP